MAVQCGPLGRCWTIGVLAGERIGDGNGDAVKMQIKKNTISMTLPVNTVHHSNKLHSPFPLQDEIITMFYYISYVKTNARTR